MEVVDLGSRLSDELLVTPLDAVVDDRTNVERLPGPDDASGTHRWIREVATSPEQIGDLGEVQGGYGFVDHVASRSRVVG